ncbi:MAG: ParB/RepB/Spo0J family partition protein [Pyrinomonadaceae bacterium]|nr:ParB/RepB/Spo0J family partition protein [Pyrinomonadaceae bacterium]
MSKRGLPDGIKMRHDAHYVEELAHAHRSIGKVIPTNKIVPNPEQPRTEIGDLTELTNSIKQNGVLEPLLVKPKDDGTWMIIAGERRWRAANLAGLSEVPCIEFDIDAKTIAEIALIENLQRKDLTVWEEADGLAFLSGRFGYTHEEIAQKIGKSRTTVTESMTLANLPESIRAKCSAAQISAKSTLLEIARQFDETAMHVFLDKIGRQNLKRDAIRRAARPVSRTDQEPVAQTNSAQNKQNKKIESDIFRYTSSEGEFNIEIQFAKFVQYKKSDVLRALKEAFEITKKNLND